MAYKIKLTKRKLKALIKDERMATKEYHALGLHNLERDEHRHKIFLSKLLKKQTKGYQIAGSWEEAIKMKPKYKKGENVQVIFVKERR